MTKLTHGFILEREQEIPELAATARIYRHEKTGGRALSLISPDENKVFGVALRTPPADSTGLPHILEHSVLCGSRKYPVKEPFVELIKGSLNTFLNALTFPDKTCYPVASANLQDFYNLVDVYLDAVFFPRLTENTLKQEGWHYDVENAADPLAFKGVVFNEMKGVYSSPDSLLAEYSQRALFPDTCYGLDSGGDPERIPDLTFKQFMDFHTRLYHPSNAYAFFSGDDDPDRRLAILDEYFSQFDAPAPGEPASEVALQPPFAEPRRSVHFYAAEGAEEEMDDDDTDAVLETPEGGEGGEGEGARAMCTVNFGLPEARDPDLSLAFEVLEHVLIGLPSSPLRKALVDSGLGEDLTGGGLETDLRQMAFSVGLKGLVVEKGGEAEAVADQVERLVLSTLGRLAVPGAEDGLHPDDIRAGLNSVEFDLRENNTGSYPRGLVIFFEALSTWLYEGDPLAHLPFEGPLARLKARLAAGEPVFQELIRTHFLENTHRALVILKPDNTLGARREAAEAARLKAVKDALSPAQVEELVQETHTLRALQEAPDSPEDLARIPRLTPADLPRENARIPHEKVDLPQAGTPAYVHDLPTSGVVYLDLAFDMSAVPDSLVPLVPILGRALLEMGTKKSSFVDLSRAIAMNTGGVWAQTFVSSVRGGGPEAAAQRLFLRGKATGENLPALLDLMGEVLLEADFSDAERLGKIIMESKARREQRLIPSGHVLATTRLKARTGVAQAMSEAMNGLSGLNSIRELTGRMDAAPESVSRDLHSLLSLLLSRRGLIVSLTTDGKTIAHALPGIGALAASLPDQTFSPAPRAIPALPEREGLCLPAQVNYVAAGGNARALGKEPGAAAAVVSKFLRAGYLWERVRVQGGAYGASCAYSRLSGNLTFASYRDPNVARTLDAYAGVGSYLSELSLDSSELEKSVVGSIGDMDHYMLPDAKGFTALARELTGEDAEYRQAAREAVLGASRADFAAFGEAVAAVLQNGPVVVAGGRDALEKSGLGLTLTKVL
ncbi:MAG TPA: insulinase family protein [Humidesulfovibrio sp.]|uniref:insulinase family protein n=1 Tax=Humidesulfovibrio sp. TaxID=2910988 RepID=UPI002C7A79B1|nr:insulinase family protein [Humidesulfovibrio sp.]HWR02780.1 insulinase family protein [Humidesulfovibrio sp.]